MNPRSSRYADYLFILLVAVVAYWPVSTMFFSVKNDAINYFMAVRYNTSEAVQHGYFPAWMPYINMGYPAHGDVQAGVWNPVVVVLSLIRKYDVYWLQLETIITIIIAGLSMYHLLNYFKLNRKVVLAVTAAYMLNGFITDSGQFLNWLYAAAYLPFVMLCVIRCFDTFKLKDAFLLGLSYSLMLLSAYPSDFIQLTYLLTAYLLFLFIRHQKQNGFKNSFFLFSKQLIANGICFLIICLPALLSYVPFIQSIDRGDGVNLETALMNSMAPENLISFVTPWPTMKANFNQYTDPLIRNCYIGIILLPFFLYALFNRKKRPFLHWFLLGSFFFFLLFSLGNLGGIRVFSFHYLPLMDTFRHPANSKLFFIFAAQLLAAFYINDYLLASNNFNKKLLRNIILTLLATVSIAIIIGLMSGNISSSVKNALSNPNNPTTRLRLKDLMSSLSFYDFLLLNSLLVSVALLIFYKLIQRNKVQKYLLRLVLAEMFITAQGMLPLTYVRTTPPSVAQNIINQQPKGYPLPDLQQSIADYSADGMKHFEMLGCLNPYNKLPGRSDYIITPANLSRQQGFWDSVSLRKKIIEYPLAYFADTIFALKDTAAFIKSAYNGRVVISSADKPLPYLPADGNASIRISKFVPGHVTFETENGAPGLFVFLQNYYPGWSVTVNKEKVDIYKANISFMAIKVPKGKNTITFVYKTGNLKLLSLFSVLFILGGLIYIYTLQKKKD